MKQINRQPDSLEHTTSVQGALEQLGKLFAKPGTHDTMANGLLRILYSIVPFDSGALYTRIQAARFELIGASRAGAIYDTPAELRLITFQSLPLLRQVLVHRRAIYLADVKQASRWRPHLPEQIAGSWAGMPLVYHGEVVGLLLLASDQCDFFSPSYREKLKLFKGVFAVFMQNAILERRKGREQARFAILSRQVITAQEEERKRISRELHDEAGQALAALTINLELLEQDLSGQSQALVDRARESVRITKQTLQTLRDVARQLRPPALEMLGLDGALEQLCADSRRNTGLEIKLTADPIKGLDEQINVALYRFVQEALTNIYKHAGATRADVRVKRTKKEIVATVQDNGVGFDPARELKGTSRTAQLGLLGIKERLALLNGQLVIDSSVGEGTQVIAVVPLKS